MSSASRTVIAVELAIIISMSLYNPVFATYRLEHTPKDRIARTLSAWSIGYQASIAIFTALGGLLADITSAARLSRSSACSSWPARCYCPDATTRHGLRRNRP